MWILFMFVRSTCSITAATSGGRAYTPFSHWSAISQSAWNASPLNRRIYHFCVVRQHNRCRLFSLYSLHYFTQQIACIQVSSFLPRDAAMLARSWESLFCPCPSVRLSVRLSHACFVTNPKKLRAIFLYHMKGQSFWFF